MIAFIVGWVIIAFILWLLGLNEENSIVIGFVSVVVIVIIKTILENIANRDPKRERVVRKNYIFSLFDFWRWRR